MKKNTILIFLSLIILIGCSKKDSSSLLVGRWQKQKMKLVSDPLRSIASTTNTNQCLGNLMNAEQLKKEVFAFESRIEGKPVQGQWNHIDLSTLPIPQANFLVKYGQSIGDLANIGSIDYSTCSDLVCIFNKIYNKDSDYVAGYIHYLWYLKFGSYLSLDNKVPYQKSLLAGQYQNTIYPISSYLYDENELYGLWGIIHLVNDKYLNLVSLKEIQRIPRGAQPEGYEGKACGLAYGNTEILLADNCLTTHVADRNKGFLYPAILHEMSHILDFTEARNMNATYKNRSETQDYLDLVGFSKEEYVDSQGIFISKWKLKPNAKYYRDYASKSPVENFADSLAFYRFEGDDILSKIENSQYDWIGKNYFNNKNFESSSKLNHFLDKYKTTYFGKLFFKVLSCSTKNEVSPSTYLVPEDFKGLTFTENMLTCLSAEAQIIADELTQEVQLSEFDGCSITKSKLTNKMVWEEEVKSKIIDNINLYVQKIASVPGFLEQMEKFKNLLESNEMANQAFLECYQGSISENFSNCYDQKLKNIVEESGANVEIPNDQLTELVALYANKFNYNEIKTALTNSYKEIIDSNNDQLRITSEVIWEVCSMGKNHDDLNPPNTGIFNPSSGYIVSSILNCLNDKMPDAITDYIDSIQFDGLNINNEKEKLILREFSNPRFLTFLNSIHEIKVKNEQESLREYFDQNKTKIVENLLSDFSWIHSLNDENGYLKSCNQLSFLQLSRLPLYHVKKDFFDKLIKDNICSVTILDEKFISFIQKSNQDVTFEINSKLESSLTPMAQDAARECIRKIPWKWERTKAVVRIPRKICFSLSWKDIETSIVEEMMLLPNVKRFKLSREYMKIQIEKRKEETKILIGDEFF